jgi:hypothetical protein
MLEIDYYSKYLKYKQKYLKEKSLQIGGVEISIDIIIKKIKENESEIFFLDQKFESTLSIKDALDNWLKQQKINFKDYTVFLNPNYSTLQNLDKSNNFDLNNVKNKNKILILPLYPQDESIPYD